MAESEIITDESTMPNGIYMRDSDETRGATIVRLLVTISSPYAEAYSPRCKNSQGVVLPFLAAEDFAFCLVK